MKRWFSLFVMISMLVSGCAAAPTQAAPTQVFPSSTVVAEASPTAIMMTATPETILGTATALVTEPTATTQPSETAQPTATSAMVITIVGGPASTVAPQPQAGSCQPPPQGWVQYSVLRNDTLSSLAQRTGVSWQQIQTANCLAGTLIVAGQSLYLPFIPQPLPTSPGGAPLPPTSPPPGPGNPEIGITPASGLPGSTFTFVMTNFSPGETILISIDLNDEIPIAGFSMVADQAGRASMGYISLADARPGTYVVRAVHLPKQASGRFTIEPPPTPTPMAQP